MVRSKGQIVNTVASGGLAVSQFWAKLFDANEAAFAAGRLQEVKTDAEITAAMQAAFPDRLASKVFWAVVKVRYRHNRGLLTGKRPRRFCWRYEQAADGSVVRTTPRGLLVSN
jgi:hypothetical protein